MRCTCSCLNLWLIPKESKMLERKVIIVLVAVAMALGGCAFWRAGACRNGSCPLPGARASNAGLKDEEGEDRMGNNSSILKGYET